MVTLNRTRTLSIAGAAALIGLLVVGALALGPSAAASQPTLSEEEAADIATEEINGTVSEIEQETEDGIAVYEIEVVKDDGTVAEVEINGDSGEILETEYEDEDDENEDEEEEYEDEEDDEDEYEDDEDDEDDS